MQAPQAVTPPPLRTMPESPGYFESFNGSRARQYATDLDLYKSQELTRMLPLAQAQNPLRDATLGQISELTDLPVSDLAHPSQRSTIPGYQSEVPSHRYVPTQNDIPSLRPEAPTPRLQAEFQDHTQSPMPTSGIGRIETGAYPQVPENRRYADPDQPSNLYQQQIAEAEIKRRGFQPRFNPNNVPGQGSVNLYNKKVSDLTAHYINNFGMDPDQAGMMAAQDAQHIKSQDERQAALGNIQERTSLMGTQQEHIGTSDRERERHNRQLEGLRNHANSNQDKYHQAMIDARETGNDIAIGRLNEGRRRQDLLERSFGMLDRAGMMGDNEKEAYKEALQGLTNMTQRDPTFEEQSAFERFLGFAGVKPDPIRSMPTSRPPVTRGDLSNRPNRAPERAQQGALVAPGAFDGAPPGKAAGDILSKGGKPHGRWNGQAWEPIK